MTDLNIRILEKNAIDDESDHRLQIAYLRAGFCPICGRPPDNENCRKEISLRANCAKSEN